MPDSKRFMAWLTVLATAFMAVALLGGGHALLSNRIADNKHRAALQSLLAAFPSEQRAHITLHEIGSLDDADLLGLRAPTSFYRAEKNGGTIGWLLPATARNGYNGDIELVAAIDPHGNIIGTQVLAQRETAGLGDRVERPRSNWLDGFNGHSLRNPTAGAWYVAKDGGKFDQITGATMTSRAVTQAVRQTLMYFEQHRDAFTASQPVTADNSHE